MLETLADVDSSPSNEVSAARQCATEPLSRLDDYQEFRAGFNNFRSNKWHSDRWVTFRLRFGIYAQKQDSMYMVRSKVPGGRMPISWLRTVAKANREHCGGDVHITTRQDLQFYFVRQDALPDVLNVLYIGGMTTREASGNTFRNTIACPLAGICPRERVDAGAVAERLATTWLRHPLVQHMPRKVKTAVSGCELDCGATSMDDLGFIATVKDGRNGFRVVAGGGLGSVTCTAVQLLDFVSEEELPIVQEAMAHMHHRYSNRKRKMASRIKFLVRRFGVDKFIKLFIDEFEHAKPMRQRPWKPLEWRTPVDDQPPPLRQGKVAQHDGLVAVVIRPQLGNLSSDILESLADIAERLAVAEFRITREQNIVAVGILPENVDAFIDGVRALGLDTGDQHHGLGDMVSCPGTSTCPIGINNSNELARQLLDDKAAFAHLPETRIRISGCHNSCGQHQIGDIGLHGVAKKINGKNVPHYQFHLGGEPETPGATGMDGPEVPARHTREAVKIILTAYADSRADGETVRSWAKRTGEDGINKLLAPLTAGGYDINDASMYLDIASDKPFFPPATAVGECAAASSVGEYMSDMAKVGRIDLQRSLAIGDRGEALEAGRRSLLSTAQRILSVVGMDVDSFDDSRLLKEIDKQFAGDKKLMDALELVLRAKKVASGGGDMEAFDNALEVWSVAADASIEATLSSADTMGNNI